VGTPSLRSLAVEVPDFPAVALGRPADVPVAVLRGNRVVAVSVAARSQGVVPGLRRREAQSRCPSLELHAHDDARDARSFEPALQALEDLAPRVEVVRAGRCVVPTRGPSRYHGGDRALSRLVRDRVRSALGVDVDVRVGVGVADGPRAAQVVAVEAARSGEPVVVPPGATADHLAPLPVRVLEDVLDPDAVAGRVGVTSGGTPGGERFADLLRRLGIRTVGHLAALPAPDVSARFGGLGRAAHQVATGRETVPADVVEAPVDLSVIGDVDPPADRVDRVAFVAKVLADQLDDRLGGRGLACTRVLVRVETVDGEQLERLWRHEGVLTPSAIAQRVRWQLDGWLRFRQRSGLSEGGVCRIGLVPDQVVADAGRQLGLWGGSDDSTERALRALARLQGHLGADAVLVPEWAGGRSPGERVRVVPLEGVDLSGRAEPPVAPWPGSLPAPSPSRIWSTLREVEVLGMDGLPVRVSGRGHLSSMPARCRLDGRTWVAVRSWAGPWCSDERWWDATAHRRRARIQVVVGDPDDDLPGEAAHLLALESGTWWLEATWD
jgi:protein ImuB